MSIGRIGAMIWPRWTIFLCGAVEDKCYANHPETIEALKHEIEVAIWMMLCFILKWKGSIFLIKPYFWKNIHKFFFHSRFNFQMLDGPPCTKCTYVTRSEKRDLRGKSEILHVEWLKKSRARGNGAEEKSKRWILTPTSYSSPTLFFCHNLITTKHARV